MKIGIGIDTGGTCTDAVVYDFAEKKVLASAKSLTTKQDLAVGIENSLNKLPEELLKKQRSWRCLPHWLPMPVWKEKAAEQSWCCSAETRNL